MWIYKASMSLYSGDHHVQTPSNTGRRRAVGPIHIHLHQGFLPSSEALGFTVLSSREPPTLPHRIQQSKAQQQLQNRVRSATIIQAAWRGYQARRELDEMNKAAVKIQAVWRGYQARRELDEMNTAAVKIQAAYRGHRIRQALPLGFYNCLRDKKAALGGKKKEEEGVMSELGVPGTLECNMLCEETSHAPAATSKTESPAASRRDRHGPSSDIIPGAAVYNPEVYLMPSKAVNHEDSLLAFEILPAVTSEQQVQNAADQIQAAGGEHQSIEELGKMEKTAEKKSEQNLVLAYSCQLKQNLCENHHISDICSITGVLNWTSKPKDMVPYPKQSLTVQIEMKKGEKASDTESEAPSIRKVDVHTVVRNLLGSQRCPISLHVSSPSGTVECSHRDMATGQLHGLYAVRGLGGLQPAYVSICIRVVEAELGRG
ncbi:uncharacterized protein LOC110390308 isoform X2 [Numida meleagris]|uniref:uncharacterized protein LOC110390308 isoform X2 n=1 Tax=Numida meleagris TaxID=8996 RepID=UPI000B3D9128|nr:uncharacterized protein LOC110390308 isoform X2 [Numida meleagris]